eukprot:765046-Hanusia_phi.AAC.2
MPHGRIQGTTGSKHVASHARAPHASEERRGGGKREGQSAGSLPILVAYQKTFDERLGLLVHKPVATSGRGRGRREMTEESCT